MPTAHSAIANSTPDYSAFSDQVMANYVKAIKRNRINYVVNLSSIGAALAVKAPLSDYYNLETRLNELTALNIVQLRPGMFYTNFYGQVNLMGIAIREGLPDKYYSEKQLTVTAERKFIPFMQEVFSLFSTAV